VRRIPVLKNIVLRVSLPPRAAKKFLEWAEKDANAEKEKSSGIVSTYQLQLALLHKSVFNHYGTSFVIYFSYVTA